MLRVRVQSEPFDIGVETAALAAGRSDIGAIVTFTGLVRDHALHLEHYPAMTLAQLHKIAATAEARWPLLGVTIIHRHGDLAPADPIVLVAVAAAHRAPAFEAAAFLMDWLKTQAPFWKRDAHGWVEARAADNTAAARWD